jgi:hypothetical protein
MEESFPRWLYVGGSVLLGAQLLWAMKTGQFLTAWPRRTNRASSKVDYWLFMIMGCFVEAMLIVGAFGVDPFRLLGAP